VNGDGLVSEACGRSHTVFPIKLDLSPPSRSQLQQDIPSLSEGLQELPAKIKAKDNSLANQTGKSHHTTKRFVKLYPDLALGMLRQEEVSAGRVWLILKYLDAAGRGWISLELVRQRLSERNSDLYICGKRQLRKLLARGEGLFWRRSHDRIWLKSTAKVAVSLDVQRLTGSPVALPVDHLLQGIGHARAHFYGSFHSGRIRDTGRGKQKKPIARSTLTRLSHTSRRSQQRYESRAGIAAQPNFALGGASTIDNDHRVAWKQGTASFRFRDSAGNIGRRGITYTAWQLPNNYSGPHMTLPKGRQKRINRELVDLFTKGMTGNNKISVSFSHGRGRRAGPGDGWIGRLYHDHSLSAAASFNQSPNDDAYWPNRHGPAGNPQFWFHISGKADD